MTGRSWRNRSCARRAGVRDRLRHRRARRRRGRERRLFHCTTRRCETASGPLAFWLGRGAMARTQNLSRLLAGRTVMSLDEQLARATRDTLREGRHHRHRRFPGGCACPVCGEHPEAGPEVGWRYGCSRTMFTSAPRLGEEPRSLPASMTGTTPCPLTSDQTMNPRFMSFASMLLAGIVLSACGASDPSAGRGPIDAKTGGSTGASEASPTVQAHSGASSEASPGTPSPITDYTPAAEGLGPGPPCPPNAACAASFAYNGVVYQLSCGALDPAEVEPEPLVEGLIAGQRVELHALRGVEPNVVLAIRPLTCDGPLDLGPEAFHLAFQHDAAFDDHGPSDPFNEAMCRAALFGTDPLRVSAARSDRKSDSVA